MNNEHMKYYFILTLVPCIFLFFILCNEPTNAQLIDNFLWCSLLYCCYMFRHYCVIFRELVVSTC